MCGIVGYAGLKKKVPLTASIETIKHRGPNDNGVAYFDGVALGNTRLAIIDLSQRGHQPMFSYDKSLCITYNGEIYNFKEVKRLLEHKYRFYSQTDTETILYAYQEWGVKCLEKLNGMFSFVIYDRKKDTLFGARDRIGQKPLKYYYSNGTFIFASEVKAILPLLPKRADIDPVAIDDFLTFQYVPSPKTGFKNIFKLPAGHYFLYKNNKLSIRKYWFLRFNKKIALTEREWEEELYFDIEKSVKSHLVSDVPVGALLSGGLDSSMIVALMAKNSSKRVHTFSIGFDDDSFDESGYARMVAKQYETVHTQFSVSAKQLLDSIPQLLKTFDEPIGDNSILPMLLVSKLTSAKVKVALTGDGGDENFAGYERYAIVFLSGLLSYFPEATEHVLIQAGHAAFFLYKNKFTERLDRFLSTIDQTFYRRYIQYNCFFTHEVKHALYSERFNTVVFEHDSFERSRSFSDQTLSLLDNALSIDINTYLPDDLLYKSDSASMAYGLELRSPFLDHSLMEKIACMPSNLKLKMLQKKYILKNIAKKRNLLPKEIIYRDKQGFTIPQNSWFKGHLKKYLRNQILSSKMNGKIFDKKKLERYIDDYFSTNMNYDNNMFALLMLSLWIDAYFSY